MMKKADANLWWIIIGAVLALLVLIVLLVVFTKQTGSIGTGLSGCAGKSGICVSSSEECPAKTLSSTSFTCVSGEICCLGTPQECVNAADCGSGVCLSYSQGKSYCK